MHVRACAGRGGGGRGGRGSSLVVPDDAAQQRLVHLTLPHAPHAQAHAWEHGCGRNTRRYSSQARPHGHMPTCQTCIVPLFERAARAGLRNQMAQDPDAVAKVRAHASPHPLARRDPSGPSRHGDARLRGLLHRQHWPLWHICCCPATRLVARVPAGGGSLCPGWRALLVACGPCGGSDPSR